jgi:transposase
VRLRQTAGTCKQLLEREVSLFRFAFNTGVEPTNNATERSIRHGVIWRKQSHGPQGETGARHLANIWSIVETCRQQGRRTWEFLTDCLRGASEGGELPSLVTPMVSAQAA